MIRFEQIGKILEPLTCGPPPDQWPSGLVASVEQDSRRIREPGLFVSVRGLRQDGRAFIEQAATRGARAVVGLPPSSGSLPYLSVEDPRKAVAILASLHYGNPSESLEIVGITGTNGKTTTSWLLQSIWERCGVPAAVLGTLGSGCPGSLRAATHTTPDAPRFQALLRDLVEEGYRAVAAEISSHALDQDRTYATRFRAVVFTNLTRDHLDYHGTFGSYRDAKRKLFHTRERGDASPAIAVVNLDDPASTTILEGSEDLVHGFGRAEGATVHLDELRAEPEGLFLRVRTGLGLRKLFCPLIGLYNGWNLLAAYAAALSLGLDPEAVEAALAEGVRIPGRMETIRRGQPFLVLVDYAHTPDALERALAAIRPLTRGKLMVVFGCGGERDLGKRPQMGEIAARGADAVFLTNDNPRGEDAHSILDAIAEGVRAAGGEPAATIPDREAAIETALRSAQGGDTVLIAGKGHEDSQETATGKRPFDDRKVAEGALLGLGWRQ